MTEVTAPAATKYVYDFAEGSREMRDLLGGKGANVCEMTRVLGPERVPAGFTITTEACVAYMRAGDDPDGLDEQVDAALARLEEQTGRRLGDARDPLLVSVRSGARESMPGMMDTVLNLGLNEESVAGLAARSGDERFAWDSYRRFVQMFGNVVRGIPGEEFEDDIKAVKRGRGVTLDTDLDVEALKELTRRFTATYERHTGESFPTEPREQLRQSIRAVFGSWMGHRAVEYRRINRIPDDWGTAVNVQQMVFGNKGEASATGVAFSRDEITGAQEPSGDFLVNAQGEDVVSGTRNTRHLHELAEVMPEAHAQLMDILRTLEAHFKDMQDVEFTVEEGHLYMLQARSAKRPAQAAVRFACDAVDEGLLTREEALQTLEADKLVALLLPTFDPKAEYSVLARGVNASPGAAKGEVVFSAEEAVAAAAEGRDVVLARPFTEADDVAGFHAARGILTSEGGKASHAALVARGMGRPAVVGADSLEIDVDDRVIRTGDHVVEAGTRIAINGTTGEVTLDDVPLVDPEQDPSLKPVLEAFERILEWADEIRALGVRTNADTPEDARRAVEFGAEGIGLCRTEHMFFGEERHDLMVRVIFGATEAAEHAKTLEGLAARAERFERTIARIEASGDPDAGELARARRQLEEAIAHRDAEQAALDRAAGERDQALAGLLPHQQADFEGLFEAMGERPVTIRLLDPPLHEFLPHDTDVEQRLARARIEQSEDLEWLERALPIVRHLKESNPMLGTRGCRLGIVHPEIYEMQVEAIFRAARAVRDRGGAAPHVEVMIPLVGYEAELDEVRRMVDAVAGRHGLADGEDYTVGTMIELPRACATAGRIARHARFFSFGTNDLTQTALGFSRDDVEGKFLVTYLEHKIVTASPFETLDVEGVGELVRMGAWCGREARPDLKVGICGEHGGDPRSIEFFHRNGLDYVSCSPFRVPIARVAAAQAQVAFPRNGDWTG